MHVTISVEEATILGSCAGEYSVTRTFTATDDCGNSTSVVQTITVVDTTAPELIVPADYTANCDEDLQLENASATDNCGDVEITVAEWTIYGDATGNYEVLREFTATDDCGNYTTGIQIITVVDNNAPYFLDVPADYSIECSEEMPLLDAEADDDCSEVEVDVYETIIEGDCPNNYQLVRTFVATDDAGNSATATQTITVNDTTAPIFSYTPDAEVFLEQAAGDQMPSPFVLVWDACDLEPTWTYEDVVIEETATTTTTQRTYTVVDDCGNSNTFVQTIVYESVIYGCTDETACNYDPDANVDNGNCTYPAYGYDCNGDCIEDLNDNGICDIFEVYGCMDPTNPAYNPAANVDDGSCLVGGCIIPFACNYDPAADYQLAGSCEFFSCAGCTDENACNYDDTATLNNGSCEYPEYGYNCEGVCNNDTDGDGICDEFEIPGCTDPTNPGYNAEATDDDGSCLVAGCTLPFACNYNPEADYLVFSSCEFISCSGCTDVTACNYDPEATISSPSVCEFPEQFYDCFGDCVNDSDGDGICDELEVPGCTDPAANNYNPSSSVAAGL